jgi:acetyl-CoA carboxylase biotin carboxylase subunit
MIHTILIANRGEIASRIIRTCKAMGIRSVAVYSEADRDAPFVASADVAVCIGESAPSASYLNQDKIIEAAKRTGANAIHPGYGFLSENAEFADLCVKNQLIFIGPNSEAIRAMGSKATAKKIMQHAGVPVVPGYEGEVQTIEVLTEEANKIGFPLLLKASAGGGGKGMRIVNAAEQLKEAIASAKSEAQNAFGDDHLIIEKYIASGRHIEFQIFGDQHNNYIHLNERECTIQRRYQKVLEESPSPVLSEETRAKMGEVAVKAAAALKYDNAGTVEFIYDHNTTSFYFLEVNTRLQVEHPVTEEVTGLDLVKLQIQSAQGDELSIQQKDVQFNGYAMELRLYAEDPMNNFMPATGTVLNFSWPNLEGLRMEAAIRSGSEITVFYDPMIAKIIIKGENRQEAFRKMQFALQQMVCLGTVTNQNFLQYLVKHPKVIAGEYDTHFIQDFFTADLMRANHDTDTNLAMLAVSSYNWYQRTQERTLLAAVPSGWRNNFAYPQTDQYELDEVKTTVQYRNLDGHLHFKIADAKYDVQVINVQDDLIRLAIDGLQMSFHIANNQQNYFVHNEQIGTIHLSLLERFPLPKKQKVEGAYEAAIPSTILKIAQKVGNTVQEGDLLMVISSMKMENSIYADAAGVVAEIYVEEGQSVAAGTTLLQINKN